MTSVEKRLYPFLLNTRRSRGQRRLLVMSRCDFVRVNRDNSERCDSRIFRLPSEAGGKRLRGEGGFRAISKNERDERSERSRSRDASPL